MSDAAGDDWPAVYLAGAVHHADDGGRGWRETVSRHLRDRETRALNPLAKYDADIDDVDWPAEKIVDEDLAMIDRADALLVAWDETTPTCGTPMEVFYASRQGIPVIVWNRGPRDHDLSPWLLAHMTASFREHGTALDAVAELAAQSQPERPTDAHAPSGDALAGRLLEDLRHLITAERDTHGDAVENQEHIAEAWTWYLRGHGLLAEDATVSGADVARLMELLKLSRGAVGETDLDHDRDVAGYAAIAAACEVAVGDAALDDLTVADGGGGE
jgi:nucleoside 2-deoxyribosyltransferase